MKHNQNCQCEAYCVGMKQFLAAQAEMMQKYGWIVHLLTEADGQTATGYNVHTHGLRESFNHPDLQIVLPIERPLAHSLLHDVVDRIKSGECFEAGKDYDKIICKHKVRFVERSEGNRKVLRIIFPDSHGSLEREAMAPVIYQKQYN